MTNFTPFFLQRYSPERKPFERPRLFIRQHHWSNRGYPAIGDVILSPVEDLAHVDRATLRSVCWTVWVTRELLT